MDLTAMSITELKALAYDLLAQGQQIQNNLNTVNQEIANRPITQQPENEA